MNAPKPQPSIPEKAGRKVVQAGIAIGALTGVTNDAKADVHKNVFMVVGDPGSSIMTRTLNLNYNDSNPGTSTTEKKDLVNHPLGQSKMVGFGYDHNIIGNNALVHAPDGTIYVYSNIGSGTTKNKLTLKLDGSNVEKWDSKDEFLISEGDTPEKTQIIGTQGGSGIIKTYDFVKDENGKITGLKLIAETNLNDNENFIKAGDRRIYKDTMVAISAINNFAFVLNKDAQGNWKIILEKEFIEGLPGWTSGQRNPVFGGPNGDVRATFLIGFDTALANKELQVLEKADVSGIMNFGAKGEYQISASEGKYSIKNSKGEVVEIKDQDGKDVKIDLDSNLSQISSNPNTFLGISLKDTVTILKITSDSPLKVEAYTLPQEATKDIFFDKGHAIIVGSDPDKDLTYLADNCPTIPNPSQKDSDNDGRGDQCDPSPLKVGEFGQSEMLPGSGFIFLCNPGKVAKSVESGDVDNISFTNMAKGDTAAIQLIGQENSKNDKLTVTLEAGFQIDPTIVDGTVFANGKPLTSTLVTTETTKLTFGAYTNAKFTFTNLGVAAPADTGPTEKDAGSNPDTGADAGSSPDTGKPDAGSTEEVDSSSPDTATQGTDAQPGKDTEEKPDTAAQQDTAAPQNNDAGKADASSQPGPDSANGPEISQQPPTGPGTKAPEGCTASPNGSSNPLRDSAPLALALGALGFARLQEMRRKYDDVLKRSEIE